MKRFALFLFSHRWLALARWDVHFLAVRLVNALSGMKSRARRFVGSRELPVLLNLGSGPRGKEDKHWVNVDGFHDRNVHFRLDFARPLPFDDNSFDGVFCEHVIEHFSYDGGRYLCAEIRRVMRPGGIFRIIVPDAELIVRTYVADPARLIAYRGMDNATAMQVVNEIFRQRYEHQFLYDWDTLRQMLADAGFSEVSRCAVRRGECADLLIDDEKYAWESLFVEARKPGRGTP